MNQKIDCENTTVDGKPAGGTVRGAGIQIDWQNGPLGLHAATCTEDACDPKDCTRVEPNGAFVAGVIQAAINRIEYYQSTQFNCIENEDALGHLKNALQSLTMRTKSRVARGVEGSHVK